MVTSRVVSGIIAAISLFSSTSLALAASAEAPALFTAAAEQAGQSAPEGALPGKRRAVKVNRGLLHGARVAINLGIGPTLYVERERLVDHAKGRSAWIGRVSGDPDSEVILATSGDAVAGTIRYRGKLFKLEPTGDGSQVLSEVRPEEPYPELDPISVPGQVNIQAQASEGAALAQGEGVSLVDVMVVYTPAAKARYGGTSGIDALITLAIEETNQAYQNSQATLQLRLVHTAEVNYQESGNMNTDLSNITGRFDDYMNEVHVLRDTYGADLVSLFVESPDYCGVAWQMASLNPAYADYAFSVIYTQCATGYYSFGHELGHNLGSAHDHANGSGGLYPHSFGYQEPTGAFRTIMAYSCPGGCIRVQHFSNPYINYGGVPTGVVDWADNALSLSDAAPFVASWRQSSVAVPPDAPDGLTARALSHQVIELAWSDNAEDETGYRVQRSQDGRAFAEIASLTANATTFSDNTLAPATTYYYRVQAYNGAGGSAYSNDASATTHSPPVSCTVAGGTKLTLADKTADWTLTNSGTATLTIDRIDIAWPTDQGDLVKMRLAGTEIWRGSDAPATATIQSGWMGGTASRQIGSGQSRVFRLEFRNKYRGDTPSQYSIRVHFAEGCSVQF